MTDLLEALSLSLRIALCATAAITIIGVPLAFAMARHKFAFKSVLETILIVPLVLPPTVVGYLILATLGRAIVFRFEGAVLAAAVVGLPLLYLSAKAGFASVDREFEDLARIAGASSPQMFLHVSLPLARRGIVSGLVLAFARALGEFGATVMVFGWRPHRLTLPISIYADYEQGEMSHAAGAVVALSAASLLLVALHNRMAGRSD